MDGWTGDQPAKNFFVFASCETRIYSYLRFMRTTSPTSWSVTMLGNYWHSWVLMLVALARQVRGLEDRKARGALQKVEDLERFAMFAQVQVLTELASLEAANIRANTRGADHLLMIVQALVLLAFVARSIKARLLEVSCGNAFAAADGFASFKRSVIGVSARVSQFDRAQMFANSS